MPDSVTPRDPLAAAPRPSDPLLDLIRNAPTGVYLVDADFRLVEISAGSRKVFSGIDPLLGRDFAEILRIVWPEPFATEAIARFRHTLATGESYRSPDTIEQRGNVAAEESYDWQITRLPMPDGRFGVVCYFHETTQQVRAERAARDLAVTERLAAESQAALLRARFDIVRDAAEVGFWFCDLPFDTLIWDKRVKEHFWLAPDATVTIDTFYERLHPDDRERTRQAIEASIANHTQYDIEYRTVPAGGSGVKWVRAIGRTFYNAAGSPIRFDGVTLDITDQKHAEQALRENDRRKDEFLAMLAHELRNPLAPIRHAAQVLKVTSPGDPRQRWARDVIERQTQHIARLVDDLLDVSRISRGKVTLLRERVDLATVVERGLEANQPLLDIRRHQVTVTLPPAPVYVHGDPTRLVQVLSNLINNAAKFTADGGAIAVSVEADGDSIVLRVRDNGMGIAAELLPHVFGLFVQADPSLDRSEGGLGIGLTLVRMLVEGHGGTVEARSDGPGHGSEFVVRLPRHAGHDETRAAGGGDHGGVAGRALRILIIEDSVDSAEMLGLMLNLRGHQTRLAYEAGSALEAFGDWQPDVVLCDIGLPGMNGYELAERLRAVSVGRARLIALSGYAQPEDRQRSKAAGFDAHLAKPVEPAALFDLLEALTRPA